MGEQRNLDSPESRDAIENTADEEFGEIVVPPSRSASIIAFGAVALVSMIFGFLLGLLF